MKKISKALLKDPQLVVAKSLEWSYPSSDNASRFGFAKTGCWTVQRTYSHPQHSVSPVALSGHADRSAALSAARMMPEPWSETFRHYHPAEAAA
jgi:hypothetical protein